MDPLGEKYPSLSPYVYTANNPLKYIDSFGKDINFAPSAFITHFLLAYKHMINTQLGAELHSFLNENPNIFVSIHVAENIGSSGRTYWLNKTQSESSASIGYIVNFTEGYKTEIAKGQRVILVTIDLDKLKKHSPADVSTIIYHELMCNIKMELGIMKKEGKDIKTAETRDQTKAHDEYGAEYFMQDVDPSTPAGRYRMQSHPNYQQHQKPIYERIKEKEKEDRYK